MMNMINPTKVSQSFPFPVSSFIGKPVSPSKAPTNQAAKIITTKPNRNSIH